MNKLEQLVENYINGNLSTAKRMARHEPVWALREALIEYAGYSEAKATLTADWLNGRDCWQAACDCE